MYPALLELVCFSSECGRFVPAIRGAAVVSSTSEAFRRALTMAAANELGPQFEPLTSTSPCLKLEFPCSEAVNCLTNWLRELQPFAADDCGRWSCSLPPSQQQPLRRETQHRAAPARSAPRRGVVPQHSGVERLRGSGRGCAEGSARTTSLGLRARREKQ